MAEIRSNLWKSALLALHSEYFPMLVEAAAVWEGVPFSNDLLRRVSMTPEVVQAVTVDEAKTVDPVLITLAEQHGEALDTVLRGAVRAYAAEHNIPAQTDGPEVV